MHRFVKEKGIDIIVEEPEQRKFRIEYGANARETYENVLQMPSTSQNRKDNSIKSIQKRQMSKHITRRKMTPIFDDNKLFRAATSNDVPAIEGMAVNHLNVNVTDQFGWSALMMASFEGHLDVVKALIELGAKMDIKSKQKDTALSLAAKKKHEDVVNYLTKKSMLPETICLSSEDECNNEMRIVETFFCHICKTEFSETNPKVHATSTLHRFNQKENKKRSPHFGIPESNIGFRMLLRQGWDRQNGLGPENDGIMYPIKTALRKPRSGLGSQQLNKPRVTHFKPFDQDAVKSIAPKPIQIVTTRKHIRIDKRRSQRKNRYLRNLLS